MAREHPNELFKSDVRFSPFLVRFRAAPVREPFCFPPQVNPMAAGAMTGGLFKSGAGPRGAALAAVIGATLAAASHFTPGLK